MSATNHQLEQQKVINQIAQQISNNSLNFSTVSIVEDYAKDSRICLTSVHFPHRYLVDQVQRELIKPLRKIEPGFYYYPSDSLHMTVKNIRVVNDPPHFNEEDIGTAVKIFSEVIPQHKKFKAYFYRLLLFPNNLTLIGTTDEELDRIIFDLDQKLKAKSIPDDKIYANSRYFFSNITLARFNNAPSEEFMRKVEELSTSLRFKPYEVSSVTLLTCNAVFQNKRIRGTWQLK
ncbi:MAG: hypothetical protein UY13_C0002G0427 [Candidatus Pacebacteria bacterium GW2011_GWB1_47_8]|nr:MAG: hypothetical protein UX28_C0001G0574 [Candidatus Pacebacteria bacterium GW2011_GWA1_46_10]KKU84515.1 MAG: hypothetical protein UY13_C0002G0427 [Candidatus Pacebacteria bacterium GW2011_GWB1_47_8]HCR81415.1 hypothetical protein [Candidatus Paceibacterota bacterium]